MSNSNQFQNPVLGQSIFSKAGTSTNNAPDTDSRYIKYSNNDALIFPNLSHDHTRIHYISLSGNTQAVTFSAPINTEDRTLHWFSIDNTNNSAPKTFTFSADYIFLDDLDNTARSYSVPAGNIFVWYGTYYDGKLRLRVASESDLAS